MRRELLRGSNDGFRPGALVDPLSCWSSEDVALIGDDISVIRGLLARSADVFDLLIVMFRMSRGLLIGIDDVEHIVDDRARWSALASTAAATGGLLFLVLPDLCHNDPKFSRFDPCLKSRRVRFPQPAQFPGGWAVFSLLNG
jgi:hypothetical protein